MNTKWFRPFDLDGRNTLRLQMFNNFDRLQTMPAWSMKQVIFFINSLSSFTFLVDLCLVVGKM